MLPRFCYGAAASVVGLEGVTDVVSSRWITSVDSAARLVQSQRPRGRSRADGADGDVEMRTTGASVSMLVVAAQAGDRRALEDLMSTHLPLVYSIVRRAVGDDPDADDVVQEVVLRALRELRE